MKVSPIGPSLSSVTVCYFTFSKNSLGHTSLPVVTVSFEYNFLKINVRMIFPFCILKCCNWDDSKLNKIKQG